MSPRANDLAARAARIPSRTTRPSTEAEAAPTVPAPRRAAAPRTDPVRVTVDLAPQAYRRLKASCDDLAAQLGRARVTNTEVLRVMVDLLDDPAVRSAVADALQNAR